MGSVVRIAHSAVEGTKVVAEIDSAGWWRDTQTPGKTTII
jgi:hypothetical protein